MKTQLKDFRDGLAVGGIAALMVVGLLVLTLGISFGITVLIVWGIAALTGWYVFSYKLALVVWLILTLLRMATSR